jgi:hypothetical protein
MPLTCGNDPRHWSRKVIDQLDAGRPHGRITPIRASVRVVRWSSFGALANRRPAWLACHTEEEAHGRF